MNDTVPNETEMEWATRAADWYVAEFLKRTEAINNGSRNIHWACPDFRVCWSDVDANIPRPVGLNVVDARLAFDAAFSIHPRHNEILKLY